MRRSRKPLYLHGYRGFESPPLRQSAAAPRALGLAIGRAIAIMRARPISVLSVGAIKTHGSHGRLVRILNSFGRGC